MIDTTDFHLQADAVGHRLPAGRRGVPWVRYEAKVEEGEFGPEIVSGRCAGSHPWSRFHWEPGKGMEVLQWIAIDYYLTKRELVEQFGKSLTARLATRANPTKTTSTAVPRD